jgi:hypothetical protein
MWAGLRIGVATRAFLESDRKRDESDSYWNISRREERAKKKLKRKNCGKVKGAVSNNICYSYPLWYFLFSFPVSTSRPVARP